MRQMQQVVYAKGQSIQEKVAQHKPLADATQILGNAIRINKDAMFDETKVFDPRMPDIQRQDDDATRIIWMDRKGY